jgi:hypothetical protein
LFFNPTIKKIASCTSQFKQKEGGNKETYKNTKKNNNNEDRQEWLQ